MPYWRAARNLHYVSFCALDSTSPFFSTPLSRSDSKSFIPVIKYTLFPDYFEIIHFRNIWSFFSHVHISVQSLYIYLPLYIIYISIKLVIIKWYISVIYVFLSCLWKWSRSSYFRLPFISNYDPLTWSGNIKPLAYDSRDIITHVSDRTGRCRAHTIISFFSIYR